MNSLTKEWFSFLCYDWQKKRSRKNFVEFISQWVISTAILAHEALLRRKESLGPEGSQSVHKVNTKECNLTLPSHVSPKNRLQHIQIWDTLGRGRGRKTHQYAWTVVDLANPLRTKESDKVASAFQAFYKGGPLK